MKISVIITAGGSSNRFGSNKLLTELNGEPLICHTIKKFYGLVDEIVIPTTNEVKEVVSKHFKDIIFAQNGSSRQQSVLNALKKCKNPDYVLIHDGARPFVTKEIIQNAISDVQKKGAVVVGIKAVDTIKICTERGEVLETPKRDNLYCVQTPQAFKYQEILDAHLKFQNELEQFSDDSSIIEKVGIPVFITEGSVANKKVTFREDIL